MTDPNTATLDECAVFCAKWDYENTGNYRCSIASGYPTTYFKTLDGAASAMPKTFGWWRSSAEWLAQEYPIGRMLRLKDTGNEILDRYRLAVACRLAMRKDAK